MAKYGRQATEVFTQLYLSVNRKFVKEDDIPPSTPHSSEKGRRRKEATTRQMKGNGKKDQRRGLDRLMNGCFFSFFGGADHLGRCDRFLLPSYYSPSLPPSLPPSPLPPFPRRTLDDVVHANDHFSGLCC